MFRHLCLQCILVFLCLVTLNSHVLAQEIPSSQIGIVIIHGKGGSPTKYVSGLANALESKGYLVANLEIPWSKKREYDTTAEGGVQEVATALSMLQSKGAQKLFVSGHSQGRGVCFTYRWSAEC